MNIRYKKESVLQKIGYNSTQSISHPNIYFKDSYDFDPFYEIELNIDYDDFSFNSLPGLREHNVMNLIRLFIEKHHNNADSISKKELFDEISEKLYSNYGIVVPIYSDEYFDGLILLFDKATFVIEFIIDQIAIYIAKQYIKIKNEEEHNIDFVYKLVFNELKDHSKTNKFLTVINDLMISDKTDIKEKILKELKGKSKIYFIFKMNPLNNICRALLDYLNYDREVIRFKVINKALEKIRR